MQSPAGKWLQFSFVNLLLVAAIGVVLRYKILFSLPNLAQEDVPVGRDEKSNKLIKKKGDIKKFTFKIKSHVELGAKDQNIDFET